MSRDYEMSMLEKAKEYKEWEDIPFSEIEILCDQFCNERGDLYGFVEANLTSSTLLGNVASAGWIIYDAIKRKVKHDFEVARDNLELEEEAIKELTKPRVQHGDLISK